MSTNRTGRGGSHLRRNRKQYLLDTFGDGTHVRCAIRLPGCANVLDKTTLTVDRWPVTGAEGGSYRYANIRPACASCNELHAANPDFVFWLRRDALEQLRRS